MKLTKKHKLRRRRQTKRHNSKFRTKKGGVFNFMRRKQEKPLRPLATISELSPEELELKRKIEDLSRNLINLNLIKNIAEQELEYAQDDYNKGIENNALKEEMLRLDKNLEYAEKKLNLNKKNIEEDTIELEKSKRELANLQTNGLNGGKHHRIKKRSRHLNRKK